jgi:hypothetical protein
VSAAAVSAAAVTEPAAAALAVSAPSLLYSPRLRVNGYNIRALRPDGRGSTTAHLEDAL